MNKLSSKIEILRQLLIGFYREYKTLKGTPTMCFNGK